MSRLPEWFIGKIPDYMHDGVMNWIYHGIDGGGFLMAILENDFYEAICRADDTNIYAFRDYKDLLNMLPGECWGSKEKVREWRRRGGLNGIEKEMGECGTQSS